ncbi:MAG: hypothetical protein L6V85_07690 [Clostridiales bacterium]|nr:MAG: hypothetical protein L6V85_07690 [Clostridiales bacterium]
MFETSAVSLSDKNFTGFVDDGNAVVFGDVFHDFVGRRVIFGVDIRNVDNPFFGLFFID